MLASKLAFITGAGSGIGKAACIALAREGAKIIAGDINYENTVKVAEIIGNDNCTPFELDVAKASSLEDVLGKVVKKYGQPPTVVVNCAGITKDNFILKMSESEFDEVIKINLKGTYLVVQMCSKLMVDRNLSGSIVNLASIIGKIGNIGQSNYAASKAGVEMITKSCAMELGKFGIRCNSILPGFVQTPMVETVPEKVKEMFRKRIALGRLGRPEVPGCTGYHSPSSHTANRRVVNQPEEKTQVEMFIKSAQCNLRRKEEVAEVILFLASDRSSYVNGASVEVTGGGF